ncbi:hypothetical protein [Arthrobacter monumenti]
MSGKSYWVRPPLQGDRRVAGLDVGRAVPVWGLSVAALVIAVAVSLPMLELESIWVLLPLGAFLLAAALPSVGTMLLSLFLLLAGFFFTYEGISAMTFLLVLAVHLLYVLYALTAALPRRTLVSIAALKTLGVTALKIQLVTQAATLVAVLTAQQQAIPAIAVLASVVILALVLLLRRGASSFPEPEARAQDQD